MSAQRKRWISFILRWTIAVVGISYVIWNIRFHDRVRILTAGPSPDVEEIRVWNDAQETDQTFLVGPEQRRVERSDLWTLPDRPKVRLQPEYADKPVELVAVQPAEGNTSGVRRLLVEVDAGRQIVDVNAVAAGQERLIASYPLVERGVNRMVREAEWTFLFAAVAVIPLIYLLTGYRWYTLLRAQGVQISLARTFIINMVGAFYNSFMPGSTGGDVAKAYYAAKHTPHRTRAVLTVIVDRVIGLLALLVLGGIMAALQWHVRECRNVAIVAAIVLVASAFGMLVFYQPTLRRVSGLDWVFGRLPMQKQVRQVVHAMEMYGRQPSVMIWAFLCSLPVHVTTIISATLAGVAFHLPLSPLYYWVIVPVIALVGAIPISPQGAGVMEVFAVQLTIHRGVTVAQAVALVMSIRLVSIFWNLVAGIFVLKGGYHAPTESEQHELEEVAEAPDDDESQEVAGPSVPSGHPAPTLT